MSLTISPIHDADGAVVGSSATARDVTEQTQAFEAAQPRAAGAKVSGEAITTCTPPGMTSSFTPAAEK